MTSSGDAVLVADAGNHCIRRVAYPAMTVSTLAGRPSAGAGYAEGQGAEAQFNYPVAVAEIEPLNYAVCDCLNHCVRKVTGGGVTSLLAGVPKGKGHGDGDGEQAAFNQPRGVVACPDGSLVVADVGNHCLRRVTPGHEWDAVYLESRLRATISANTTLQSEVRRISAEMAAEQAVAEKYKALAAAHEGSLKNAAAERDRWHTEAVSLARELKPLRELDERLRRFTANLPAAPPQLQPVTGGDVSTTTVTVWLSGLDRAMAAWQLGVQLPEADDPNARRTFKPSLANDSYTLQDLEPGELHRVQARYLNDAGWGDWSKGALVRTRLPDQDVGAEPDYDVAAIDAARAEGHELLERRARQGKHDEERLGETIGGVGGAVDAGGEGGEGGLQVRKTYVTLLNSQL